MEKTSELIFSMRASHINIKRYLNEYKNTHLFLVYWGLPSGLPSAMRPVGEPFDELRVSSRVE
jgi:hypothetical protein